MEIELKELLKTLNSQYKNVYYHENGGNAGDALINVGFYNLAESAELDYSSIGNEVGLLKNGDVVLVAGGGCIVPEWDSVSMYVEDLLQTDADIIVLPQSVNGRELLLKSLRCQDIIILREAYSYEYCKNLNLRCNVAMSKDTAFYIEKDQAKIRGSELVKLISLKNLIRCSLVLYHLIRSSFCKSIGAFRCDSEAANINVKGLYIMTYH